MPKDTTTPKVYGKTLGFTISQIFEGGMPMNMIISRADLKAYFTEGENKPLKPRDAPDSYLLDDSFLLPAVKLLSVIFDTPIVSDNTLACNDGEYILAANPFTIGE